MWYFRLFVKQCSQGGKGDLKRGRSLRNPDKTVSIKISIVFTHITYYMSEGSETM